MHQCLRVDDMQTSRNFSISHSDFIVSVSIQRQSLEHRLCDSKNVQAMKCADRIRILTFQKKLKELNDVAKEKELVVQNARSVFKWM